MLRRRKADVVVGFGGYPSQPTMLAALLLRKRAVIHDQNAVLGRGEPPAGWPREPRRDVVPEM